MKQFVRLSLATALLAGATGAYAQDCDRACLGTMLDQYLNAVVKHDPTAAPLVVGVRQTENAINVSPGYGVWKSVTALGEVQRRYFDPVSSQAAYYGSVEEGDSSALVTVRIRVENQKITEAEWYIARENDPGLSGERQPGRPPANLLNIDYLKDNGPPIRTVPVAERSDRDTLIRIAESYFDAITSHDRTVALAHVGCGRAENGSPAPGGSFLPPLPAATAAPGPAVNPANTDPAARDCLAGLENFNLSMVTARRYPMVDVEAQAVLSYGVFIRRPGSTTPRNVLSEWFFIDGGKIRTVYTAMFYPPATLAVPNWAPYDGNFPLAAGVVPTPAPAP
ncbi:MAG: hypothetical protein V4603_15320 [Pseudomonadota bacterium]